MPELEFDLNQYEARQGFTPPPPGEHVAAVESSEINPNNAGTGRILKLSFQIIAGEHKGKSLLHFINIVNASDKAEKIAREELAALSVACGKDRNLKRTEELHGIPVTITVGIENDQNGTPRARIQRFKAYTANGPATPAKGNPSQAQAAGGDDTPPWGSN